MGAQTTWGRRRVGACDVAETGGILFVQSGCTIQHRPWQSLADDWRTKGAVRVGVSKDSYSKENMLE